MQEKPIIHALVAGICALALADTASAQSQAYTNAPVDVYAGPAPDYPIVAQVPPGQPLTVMGCVEGYTWCDVAAPELRGWAYGGYLAYPYQGGQVPILTYGVRIGLPIIGFSIGDYWGHYYRGRPWYHDQPRYANHPPHGGPPPHAGPPPHGMPPPAAGGRPPEPPPAHYGGNAPPSHGYAPEAVPHGGAPAPQAHYDHAPEPPHGAPPPQAHYEHAPEPPHGAPPPQAHGGPAPSQRAGGEPHGNGGGNHEESH
jgi:uncharacterized protein YraI